MYLCSKSETHKHVCTTHYEHSLQQHCKHLWMLHLHLDKCRTFHPGHEMLSRRICCWYYSIIMHQHELIYPGYAWQKYPAAKERHFTENDPSTFIFVEMFSSPQRKHNKNLIKANLRTLFTAHYNVSPQHWRLRIWQTIHYVSLSLQWSVSIHLSQILSFLLSFSVFLSLQFFLPSLFSLCSLGNKTYFFQTQFN